jgi:3-hydroxyisobutyrate dehydrogenase
MTKVNVAFLGLGLMGAGMAERILSAGFPLVVYNRNHARASALGAKGARIASTPRDAAKDADVIVSMLADDDACRGLWLGPSGALAGAQRGAVLVEASTVSVGWIRELASASAAAGCELLDAPVTGSKSQAAAGELLFLVGGDERALTHVRPILSAMSRDIVHLGPTGSGTLLKLINNFVCGVQLVSLAEGLTMIERSGLNRDQALAVLTGGAPGSPLVKALAGRMAAQDYQPNFLLKLMAKDLRYAIEQGHAFSLDLATAPAALNVLSQAIDAGLGESDLSAVIELFRKNNGATA